MGSGENSLLSRGTVKRTGDPHHDSVFGEQRKSICRGTTSVSPPALRRFFSPLTWLFSLQRTGSLPLACFLLVQELMVCITDMQAGHEPCMFLAEPITLHVVAGAFLFLLLSKASCLSG